MNEEELESDLIEPKDLCKAIFQRWKLLVVCAVIAAALFSVGSIVKNAAGAGQLPSTQESASAPVSDDATPQEEPDTVQNGISRKSVAIASAAGLILACIYVVLDYLLNPKVRTEFDVQKNLGLKLLGTIPAGKERKSNG